MDRAVATREHTGEYRGDGACSLARAVSVVGEKWTFFIVREALAGTSRFSDFRTSLGIAPDVLTARLETLVNAGLMERAEYREPGQRTRAAYHLTEAGQSLAIVIASLQSWGDRWTPSEVPTSVQFVDETGRPVSPGFVDVDHVELNPGSLRIRR